MTTERGARGLYIVAVVIGVVGVVLGVITIAMGHAVEGLLTVIAFLAVAGAMWGITRWAKRADDAKAAQRRRDDEVSDRS